jgi:alpha,alpha-trehalose phosphorylase
MRDHDGVLSFTPRLPQALTRLTFRLCFRARRLLVHVGHEQATYSLLDGSSLEIVHHGKHAIVHAQRPLTRRIPPPPARESPTQPRGRAPQHRRTTP